MGQLVSGARTGSHTRGDERPSILLVDDDDLFVDAAAEVLRARGYAVQTAGSIRDAKAQDPAAFDLLLVDDHLPDGSGLHLASQVNRSRTRVVLVSASPRLEAAVEAIRLGFSDFLPKPLDFESLLAMLRPGAGEPRRESKDEGELLPSLAARIRYIEALARSTCPVLVTGETGTGKGHLARAIHARAGRPGRLIAVNCAAIPATLFESELFGVERGAFTGAHPREGLIELAHQGTLFLDEIGELPLALQAKLLTFLDDGVARRVGGVEWKQLSVRVVAATHKDLDVACRAGDFRADLLHRLDVARVDIAALRERRDDVVALVDVALRRLGARDGATYALADGELDALRALPWPGNIRELHNAIERAVLEHAPGALAPSRCVRRGTIIAATASSAPLEDLSLDAAERRHILDVLARCEGNRTRAAELLGIGVSTLRRKLGAWGEGGT
jgi:DNA-binding NtrC family response regulator